MAVETYEELEDGMSDILSSGPVFEMTDWHREQLAELFGDMDRDSLVEQLNMYYATQDPSELREGELEVVADLLNDLDTSLNPVSASVRIFFE